jgi:hypothetical protein
VVRTDERLRHQYHPRDADVVAGMLSQTVIGSLNNLFTQQQQLIKEMEELELKIVARDEGGFCAAIIIEPKIRGEIKLKHMEDRELKTMYD